MIIDDNKVLAWIDKNTIECEGMTYGFSAVRTDNLRRAINNGEFNINECRTCKFTDCEGERFPCCACSNAHALLWREGKIK